MGIILALTLLNLTLYLFCLLALPLLGMMFLLAIGAIVLLARFGAGWILVPVLRCQWRMARALVGSLRLAWEEEKHLKLTEQDAPHLFATVRDCARRVGCLEPTEIVLEAGCNAWVKLEGLRAGHGKCT